MASSNTATFPVDQRVVASTAGAVAATSWLFAFDMDAAPRGPSDVTYAAATGVLGGVLSGYTLWRWFGVNPNDGPSLGAYLANIGAGAASGALMGQLMRSEQEFEALAPSAETRARQEADDLARSRRLNQTIALVDGPGGAALIDQLTVLRALWGIVRPLQDPCAPWENGTRITGGPNSVDNLPFGPLDEALFANLLQAQQAIDAQAMRTPRDCAQGMLLYRHADDINAMAECAMGYLNGGTPPPESATTPLGAYAQGRFELASRFAKVGVPRMLFLRKIFIPR